MIKVIQFISAGYLKARTNVNTNVSDKIINPVILETQELSIMSVIGERLYTKIAVDIDDDNLAGDYLTLVNKYIAPALAYRTYERLINVMAFKVAEGNVYRATSDNAEATSMTDLAALRRGASMAADDYSIRLEKYLCHNNAKFPEYMQSTNEEVTAKKLSTFNGLSLGDVYERRINEYKNDEEEA